MKKIISSSSNNEIKRIRKLRERKERDASGLFFVEGLRHVIEAVQNNAEIEEIVYCPELLKSEVGRQIIKADEVNKINTIEVNEVVFRTLSLREGPTGLAAVVRQKWDSIGVIEHDIEGIWVALDEIQDPGNLGAILRTLDAVGGRGVILLDNTTDVYHPTTIRASMGAIFTQKIIKINRSDFIDRFKQSKIILIGAICDNEIDYHQMRYPSKMILAMGSEQKGLSTELTSLCNELVHIPMIGKVDSLNLACATSIILYEIFNQHRMDTIKGQRN